jgi:hypothetical protein
MENIGQSVNQRLFADDTRSVYAVLDGASVPGLLSRLRQYQPEYICLYRGELAPDMAQVAPYLVHLEIDTDFTGWVTDEGWGKHWGIFALSRSDFSALRQQFRNFLTVYDPDARPLLFRYYDPRVLRKYLPTCNSQELATVFGQVDSYLLEGEQGEAMLSFQVISGKLKIEKLELNNS